MIDIVLWLGCMYFGFLVVRALTLFIEALKIYIKNNKQNV